MDINKARFYNLICSITFDEHERYNIGTYKEKKLHIILKKYFEPNEDYHEVPTNGFIADVRRDGVITEIETNGFSGLGGKLAAYLPEYHVNLVYPLAAKKYVSWIDPETREISPRKKSPVKATAYDLLFELVRILPYVKNENISFISPLLEIDEYKLRDGWSRDGKRGAHRFERMPTDIYGMIVLSCDDDFRQYIPENCTGEFTVKDFSAGAHIRENDARAVIKVLEARGVIGKSGKRGRAFVYSRT